MVKPPKTMEPEAVSLDKAGRDATKAFGEDSFRNYMGRKIDLQRKQFGLVLPPPPTDHRPSLEGNDASSLGSPSHNSETASMTRKSSRSKSEINKKTKAKKAKRTKFGISKVIQKLKKRHGDAKCSSSRTAPSRIDTLDNGALPTSPTKIELSLNPSLSPSPVKHGNGKRSSPDHERSGGTKRKRSDLFFLGVVVIVNGYTNPDTETLQRLLHRHGGDLEKYETSRVTHVIAESLSTAKANIYKRQKQPRPVCKPSWITDSVTEGRLLPASQYLIDEVKADGKSGLRSVAPFFSAGGTKASNVLQDRTPVKAPDTAPHVRTATARRKSVSFAGLSQTEPVEEKQPKTTVNREGGHDSETGRTTTINQKESCDPKTGVSSNACSSPRPFKPAAQVGAEEVNDDIANTPSPTSPSQQPESNQGSESEPTRYINGRIRTVGTDPNFLESFFAASRLSFIGSYKQRSKQSPTKTNSVRGNKKKRYVFHVDLDSFFASVVLRNYPQYKDLPVAISHHGEKDGTQRSGRDIPANSSSECATCNYEARKYGIKKGMYLGQARALCPELIVLAYDFQGYEEVSTAMYNILDDYAVKLDGYVEQVSCDEAYVELYIADSDSVTSANEGAAEIAEAIRNKVFDATRCTASVGVAKNKFIAKLATDAVKPNGSFVAKDPKELLRPLMLKQLHGVGYRLNRRLEENGLVSVQDVWDMGTRGESELCRLLGPGLGKKINGFCNGIDDRNVEPAERKTIGAECNYGVRFDGPFGVDHMIGGLCQEVERRMNKVGVRGSRITLKVKQRKPGAPPPPKFLGHGSCHNLSKSCDLLSGKASRDWQCLNETATTLLKALDISPADIRGMGIVVSKLISDDGNYGNIAPKHRAQNSISTLFAAHCASKEENSQQNRPSPKVGVVQSPFSEVDVWSDGEVCGPKGQDADGVVLPPLGQIHMSQITVLPSPLRKEICAKMKKMQRSSVDAVSVGSETTMLAVHQPGHRAKPGRRQDDVELEATSGIDKSPDHLQNQAYVSQTTVPKQLNDRGLSHRGLAQAETPRRFDDVALPPMSQIHMSQVKALPRALQTEIIKKMESEAVSCDAETQNSLASKSHSCAAGRLRQTDMKRMLKLAAVKSKPGDFSLSQLESLPLEVQLQVANNDTECLGLLSPPTRGQNLQPSIAKGATARARISSKQIQATSRSVMSVGATPLVPSLLDQPPAPSEFFLSNILPLRTFMDSHPDASTEARNGVLEFFNVCISEQRLSDVAVLLRYIYRRDDAAWGRVAYKYLVSVVDHNVFEVMQCNLDLDWIEGDES